MPCLREGSRGGRAAGVSSHADRRAQYRRFPVYMVGYALASSARDRLVQMVLGIGAGAAAVGRFGLAYRVTFAPNSLVYSAVSPYSMALQAEAAKLRSGGLPQAWLKVTFVVLVVPYVAFAIEAPPWPMRCYQKDGAARDRICGAGGPGAAAGGYLLARSCLRCVPTAKCRLCTRSRFTLWLLPRSVLSRLMNRGLVAWAFGALAIVYYWVYFWSPSWRAAFRSQHFAVRARTGL